MISPLILEGIVGFIRNAVNDYQTNRAISRGLAELRSTYESQGLVVSTVPTGTEPKFQLAVALGWTPAQRSDQITHCADQVRAHAEKVAGERKLESYGHGPVVAAGGEYVVYLGLRKKNIESRTESHS